MNLLFLDTETSGLSPAEGQVIEIAGVVADLDPHTLGLKIVSEFSSLVRLRFSMDDRITRITGITSEELQIAPSITETQTKWADWLESFGDDIVGVVGHSIQFDLAFFKAEGWYLPENIIDIDTLDLSKICFPEFTAVNLEFLMEKLEIDTKNGNNTEQSTLTAHRALYDTKGCLVLFEEILKHLLQIGGSQVFYNFVVKHFLRIQISFVNQPTPYRFYSHDDVPPIVSQLTWSGKIRSVNLNERLNAIERNDLTKPFSDFFGWSLNKEVGLVACQIYVIYQYRQKNPTWHYKLHGHRPQDYVLAELIMEVVNSTVSEHAKSASQQPSQLTLSPLEGVIGSIGMASDEIWEIATTLDLLDFYQATGNKPDDESYQKTLASYDFLLLALQPFWQKSEYFYNPHQLPPEQSVIRYRFSELCNWLALLKPETWNQSNPLQKLIQMKLVKELESIGHIDTKERFRFAQYKNGLVISRQKTHFELRQYSEDLISKFPKLHIETFLNADDARQLLDITGMAQVIDYKSLHYKLDSDTTPIRYSESIGLLEFFENTLNIARTTKKPILILCGQNSGLKDSQRILTDNFNSKEYLALGESGSLTKIGSKLVRQFVGLMVCKVGDFGYLSRLDNLPEFAEIWILGEPYVPIHSYWRKQAEITGQGDFLKQLKQINLRGQAGLIYDKTNLEVGYIKSYSI